MMCSSIGEDRPPYILDFIRFKCQFNPNFLLHTLYWFLCRFLPSGSLILLPVTTGFILGGCFGNSEIHACIIWDFRAFNYRLFTYNSHLCIFLLYVKVSRGNFTSVNSSRFEVDPLENYFIRLASRHLKQNIVDKKLGI